MHSALVRLQNVFGFFTTVAFVIATFVAISSYTFPTSPTAEISVRNVQVVKGRPHYHSRKKEEYAHIRFDMEADFTSLFNWNTKQLFVWVEATYPSLTPEAPASRAVIWDQIIKSPAQENTPWTTANACSYLPGALSDLIPACKLAKRDAAKRASAARAKARSAAKSAANKVKKAVGVEVEGGEKPGRISLKNAKPKYQITDVSGELSERANVTLSVGWNVQPWVGVLAWTMPQGSSRGRWQGVVGGHSKAFDMPALKGKKPEVVGDKATPKAGGAEPVAGRQH